MAMFKLLQGKFTKKTDKGIKTFRAGVDGHDMVELDSDEIKMLGDRVKKLSAKEAKNFTLTINPAKKEEFLTGNEEETEKETEEESADDQ